MKRGQRRAETAVYMVRCAFVSSTLGQGNAKGKEMLTITGVRLDHKGLKIPFVK